MYSAHTKTKLITSCGASKSFLMKHTHTHTGFSPIFRASKNKRGQFPIQLTLFFFELSYYWYVHRKKFQGQSPPSFLENVRTSKKIRFRFLRDQITFFWVRVGNMLLQERRAWRDRVNISRVSQRKGKPRCVPSAAVHFHMPSQVWRGGGGGGGERRGIVINFHHPSSSSLEDRCQETGFTKFL